MLWGRVAAVSLVLLSFSTQEPPPLQAQEPDSASAVRGKVLEHETGKPLASAAVSLASGPGETDGIGTRITNAEGNFLFSRVPGSFPPGHTITPSACGEVAGPLLWWMECDS